MNLTVDFKS